MACILKHKIIPPEHATIEVILTQDDNAVGLIKKFVVLVLKDDVPTFTLTSIGNYGYKPYMGKLLFEVYNGFGCKHIKAYGHATQKVSNTSLITLVDGFIQL